jgi:hypothetical protein
MDRLNRLAGSEPYMRPAVNCSLLLEQRVVVAIIEIGLVMQPRSPLRPASCAGP